VTANRSDDERVRRIGLNQAVYRTVNERVKAIAGTLKVTPERLLLVCECGDPACEERIELSCADYEALRSEPAFFAVVPGHAADSVETVIRRGAGFEVVRKKPGEPANLAAETDPRSG
jgi:hypothetical protein